LPDEPYLEQSTAGEVDSSSKPSYPSIDLIAGMRGLNNHKTLVIGVATDILFPAWQQREVVDTLQAGGNKQVVYTELGEDVSLFGHDTFLLDVTNVGGNVSKFLD